MKKITKLISLLCLAAAFVLASCSSPSSGGNPGGGTGGGTGNGTGGGTGGNIYIGSKAPTEPKDVGDIVFNDGSATPYAKINERTTTPKITDAEKAAAIAVIFYVGTGLNSDVDGNPDNTISRTLGVGLKHDRNGCGWCASTSVKGYSTKITTIQCTTTSGDKNGSDNYEQMAAFSGINDTNDLNNYPAFQFGKEYSTTATAGTAYDKSGWYLPSLAELYAIYNVKTTVNAASYLCGGSQFGSSSYWSSSQYASGITTACRLNFNNGDWTNDTKDSTNLYVCAVRAFN